MVVILAFITAVLSAVPLLVARKGVAAFCVGCATFLVFGFIYFVSLPSLVWPLWGGIGLSVALIWIVEVVVMAIIASENYHSNSPGFIAVFPVLAVLAFIGRGCTGCSAWRANDYTNLLGKVEKREWTQDVQPKDPKHVRLVPPELARWLADKQLGEAPGAIGSQFSVSDDNMTLQMIRGELWYVAPLDFRSFSVWTSADVAPGYVMVHAEDPLRTAIVKTGDHFAYMPGAYFGRDLERHLWNNGYASKGLTDYTFEIDEDDHPWWVATVFEPTIAWWGQKVLGVVVVNPRSGEHTFYSLDQVPKWIDRVVPQEFIKSYVDYRGSLAYGWLNSWWGHKDVTEGETPTINYGSDGEPYWVTCVTSTNLADAALVGLMYTNSRTGKTVFYHATGGTEAAILTAVNNKVSYKKWHGNGPVLYNVYGTMASIVPLLGEHHTFQGVAIVNVQTQQVAEGSDQHVAFREYQKMLSLAGQQVVPETAHNRAETRGTVDRFAFEVKGAETLYYVHLIDGPRLFVGVSELSPELPVTRVGDVVQVGYVDSSEDVVPLLSFDNLSVTLSQTPNQKNLRERVDERKRDVREHRDARDLRNRLNQMSDDELRDLQNRIDNLKRSNEGVPH